MEELLNIADDLRDDLDILIDRLDANTDVQLLYPFVLNGNSLWDMLTSLPINKCSSGRGCTFARVIRALKRLGSLDQDFPAYSAIIKRGDNIAE